MILIKTCKWKSFEVAETNDAKKKMREIARKMCEWEKNENPSRYKNMRKMCEEFRKSLEKMTISSLIFDDLKERCEMRCRKKVGDAVGEYVRIM